MSTNMRTFMQPNCQDNARYNTLRRPHTHTLAYTHTFARTVAIVILDVRRVRALRMRIRRSQQIFAAKCT